MLSVRFAALLTTGLQQCRGDRSLRKVENNSVCLASHAFHFSWIYYLRPPPRPPPPPREPPILDAPRELLARALLPLLPPEPPPKPPPLEPDPAPGDTLLSPTRSPPPPPPPPRLSRRLLAPAARLLAPGCCLDPSCPWFWRALPCRLA